MQEATWRSKRGRDVQGEGDESAGEGLLLFASAPTRKAEQREAVEEQRANLPSEQREQGNGLTETFRPSDLLDELGDGATPSGLQMNDSQATEDYDYAAGLPPPSAQQKVVFPPDERVAGGSGTSQLDAIDIDDGDEELFHDATTAGQPMSNALRRPGGSQAFPLAKLLFQANQNQTKSSTKLHHSTKKQTAADTRSTSRSSAAGAGKVRTSISPEQAAGEFKETEWIEDTEDQTDSDTEGDDDDDDDDDDDEDDPELRAAIRESTRDQNLKKPKLALSSEQISAKPDARANGTVDFTKYDWSSQSKLRIKIIPAFRKECCRQLLGDFQTLQAFKPFIYHKSMKKLEGSSDEVFNSKSFPSTPAFLPEVDAVVGPDDEEQLLAESKHSEGSKYSLRSYQEEGVKFLLSHFHRGLSCILGDDMGLGKTVQLSFFLGVLHHLYDISGPHLVVAPLSTLSGWTRELARWAPKLSVVKLHGKIDARYWVKKQCRKKPQVVITTNATFIQEEKFMKSLNWVVHMVDEAHTLKSDGTRLSGLCQKMSSAFRVAITGTPIQNGAVELWNIMAFLYPFLCRGASKSGEEFEDVAKGDREDTGRALKAKTTGRAATLLDCVMLRRLKTVVEKCLPPKTVLPLVSLAPTDVQDHMLSLWRSKVVEAQSTELRQMFHDERKIANHPFTVKLLADEERGSITDFDTEGNSPGVQRLLRNGIDLSEEHLISPSAKMVRLDSLCRELKAAGHRALIFSNYTSQLDLLEGFCRLRDYTYERLDGSSSRVDREVSMRRFNPTESGVFLFLITTTAGGVGITLTGADTVVLYDSHYNPQMDRQAEDRAYRIGQTRPVSVYRFYVKGTIEEQIVQRAHAKALLGDFIVDKKSVDLGGEDSSESLDDSKFFSAKNLRSMMQSAGGGTESWMKEKNEGLADEEPDVLDVGGNEVVKPSETAKKLASTLWAARQTYLEAREERKGTYVGKSIGGGQGRTYPPQGQCFYCDEDIASTDRSLKPKEGGVFSCVTCSKEYHSKCVKEINDGSFPKYVGSTWSCPRHECSVCGRDPSSDGGMFYCILCLTSLCIDCLDPSLFELHPVHKTHFMYISKNYSGMEMEGMRIKKGVYYLLCEDCQEVEDSSSNLAASRDALQCAGEEQASSDEDAVQVSQKRRKSKTVRSEDSKHCCLMTNETPARHHGLLEGATVNRNFNQMTTAGGSIPPVFGDRSAPRVSLMDLSRKNPRAAGAGRPKDPRPPVINFIDDE